MLLAAPEYQEINGQVKVTWRTLRTIAHYLMVHARIFEGYIHFAIIYTTDHILLVLSIKNMINNDDELTTPFKLTTGAKPSLSHLRVLFCPFVVWEATAHVRTKSLNMFHQVQRVFAVYLLEFHSIKNGILCTYQEQGR